MTDLLTGHERRILAFLDQRGPTHRWQVVASLASPDTKTGRGVANGSNGAAPLIMASWCRRLIAAGYVVQRNEGGFYRDHAITDAGRRKLRETANA
jgi:hypothetical protein